MNLPNTTDEERAQLQTWLTAARAAWQRMMVGAAEVPVTHPDESVTYRQANKHDLAAWIRRLEVALGERSAAQSRPRARKVVFG